jgi:hypothetical protein
MGQRHSLFAAPALLGTLLCLPPSITAAQAGQDRVIGICHLSANPYDPTSAQNSLSPPVAVKGYYFNYEKKKIQGPATVRVLKMPEHGKLIDGGGRELCLFTGERFPRQRPRHPAG